MLSRRLVVIVLVPMFALVAFAHPASANTAAGQHETILHLSIPLPDNITQVEHRALLARIAAANDAEGNRQGGQALKQGWSFSIRFEVVGTTIQTSVVTTGWSRGTIDVEGDLYRPDNSLAWKDGAKCLKSMSCTFPTHFTDCACQHGTWQLYAYADGPNGSDATRRDLTV